MTLTLGTIRNHGPCELGWRKLIKALGTTRRATQLSIGDVVLSNGLDDALWCLRCLEPRQRVAAVMPAVRRASAFTTDQRVHDCIAAIERWLGGDDSVDLRAAEDAVAIPARDVTRDGDAAPAHAAYAAWAAARAITTRAAAARATTWAARATARAATWAAEDAERDRQIADLLAMFPPIRIKETTA